MNLESVEQIRVLGSSLNILYVEDDTAIREQVEGLLKRIFRNVDSASNGEDAFIMYKEKEYDIVLTDLAMPKLDGVELTRKIMQDNPSQEVMVISAHRDVEQLVQLIDLGVSGFILKPINIQKFIQKIHIKVKEIYANKMMKEHYNEMKEQIGSQSFTQEELQKRDPLTSVYNFNYLERCLKKDEYQSAILLNIKDFKLINDYYSHNHGNHLLFQLASILVRESKRYNFDVFRVSGDEFLLLYNQRDLECRQIKEDIENILEVVENKKFNIVGVKDINITLRASYTCTKNRLLEELKVGQEYAKKHSCSVVSYKECSDFHTSMHNIVETKKLLKNAVEKSTIVPVYQPILMLNNDVKYEVLMRIEDDEKTLLTPDKFLEIAKAHNYYNEISEMLIFKALENVSSREETFSVNISFLDMKNFEFVDRLEKKILEYDIAHRVVFEIIESETLEDMEIVNSFIKRFKSMGIKFAIDDFGSGYSNFAYIFKLNPDFIKLDGSLILNILSDKSIYTLVESIIDLAHKLNIEVIAEFVSTKEIYDVLSTLGVDAMQGYYLGRPDREIKKITQKDAA